MSQEVTYPVELYVYDLSGGLARQLSASLLGRHIDAVYHTSIVIKYPTPREFFFGQGISITSPGGSHHGRPMEIIPLGNTSIDEETWNCILEDLKQRYTPAAYNLMNNNCNNFSDEVANLLVGRSIPAHITSLPADFQNALGSIAARTGNGPTAAPAGPSPLLGLMDQINQRAQGTTSYGQSHTTSTSSAPNGSSSSNLFNITSTQQLDQILQSWPCAVVLFTNTRTCPPCKMLHPRFEEMAREYSSATSGSTTTKRQKRIAFVVVDSSPASQGLMMSHAIRGTPTLKFYVKGKERHRFSGADVSELRSQVDLTLFDVYVAHPHTQLKPPLTAMNNIPTQPILSSSIPNFASAVRVLDEAVSAFRANDFKAKADVQDCRKVIVNRVVPWLEARFGSGSVSTPSKKKTLSVEIGQGWRVAASTLMDKLPTSAIFPLVDMLRVATLDPEAVTVLTSVNLLSSTLAKLTTALATSSSEEVENKSNRALWLTTLRLIGNVLASGPAREGLKSDIQPLLSLVVSGVLHSDKAIRNAASSALFNLSLWRAEDHVDFIHRRASDPDSSSSPSHHPPPSPSPPFTEDLDTEALSSLIQAIQNEEESPEVLHRLLASLFLLVHLSEGYEALGSLMEVLELGGILREKLQGAGGGEVLRGAEKEAQIRGLIVDCMRLGGLGPV